VLARILKGTALGVLALLLVAGGIFVYRARDRHPGYRVDLRVAPGPPAPLRAGFAAVPVTPDVRETWTDRNGNARIDPDEPWQDADGDGRFDAFWLAGFHGGRPATGVHDDLWARALVLDDGRTRLALVVLDAIGFMHDQVVEVRERIPDALGVTYTIVCSTHTHQAPDLMGVWGPKLGRSGIRPDYLEQVIEGAAEAVEDAVAALRPARLRLAAVPEAAAELVTDSRPPVVLDPGVRILAARDAETGEPLGQLVTWGNHPETTWSHNLLVSSDFPHYVRQALERDLGGISVYASGAIGGLMTTLPDFGVRDPETGVLWVEPSFEKARAQGERVAALAAAALRGEHGRVAELARGSIALRARTLDVELDNGGLMAAALLGFIPRGFSRFGALRSEVAAVRLGPASFLAVPGEIYPEIVNGGIESPDGADFNIAPVEEPPLRELMPGRFRFVLGLANDALGYIIPRSQWDDEPPWLYGAEQETYGEIVSMGPETGPLLHAAFREVLAELD
jgi:hypothetical protein